MFETHCGDILTVDHGIVVHGCNSRGRMGAGLALAVRRRYPEVWSAYEAHHRTHGLKLGDVLFVEIKRPCGSAPLLVANAITQRDYGTQRVQVDYLAIESCLRIVEEVARERRLPVHLPRIGCGLAGGSWDIVLPIVRKTLFRCETHIWETAPTHGVQQQSLWQDRTSK